MKIFFSTILLILYWITESSSNSQQQELTESQKKLVEEEPTQTLGAQEDMKISGSNARHMVMQKLMRPSEVCISL